MVFVLGAVAVLLALVVGLYGVKDVAWGELGVLALLLFVVWRGRSGRWKEKSLNYRILAEELRVMRYLAPLALSPPFSRPPPHVHLHGNLQSSWVTWHLRTVLRAGGLVDAAFTLAYRNACRELVRSEWVKGQQVYHERNHVTLHRAHVAFEVSALAAALGAVLAVVVHVAEYGADFHLFDHPLLTFLAAGLPAVAGALHGVLTQAEMERLEKRSESMARWLEDEHEALRASPDPGTGAPSRGVRRVAQRIAQRMVEEVNDWQVLSRAGDIPVP
jgi:hypothetical protein